ncbi:MAG: Hsp20/alpha crystallin family protein [Pseudomonadota bacterium]
MTESKELQAREKKEVAAPAEQTQPGPVFTPAVDIFETQTALTLLADMPGVASEDMVIDLRDDVLTITGAVKPFEGKDEKDVLAEFEVGRFHRQFSLSEAIDQSRIEAKLTDGVLRLSLPKAKKAVPRKITVTSS